MTLRPAEIRMATGMLPLDGGVSFDFSTTKPLTESSATTALAIGRRPAALPKVIEVARNFLRFINERLVCTQGRDRIHRGRAARREETSERRHRKKDGRNGQKRQRIIGRHAVQNFFH